MSGRIKPYIERWDKSFKETDTQYYNITMQISLHGFYFTLFDPDKNKHLGLEAYHLSGENGSNDIAGSIDMIVKQHKWLNAGFNKVQVLCNNSFSTLVPAPLFKEENKALFLEFNQPTQENHQIGVDYLQNTEAVNVYYISGSLVKLIKNTWPLANVSHFSSCLMECLALNYKNKIETDTLFINVNHDNYNLVSFKNNKLAFYNTFSYKTKEDFIYFLLATMEQLGFNPVNSELILMGNIERGGHVFQMIHQYVGSYYFIEPNAANLSFVLDEIRQHQFYTLLNAQQCEL